VAYRWYVLHVHSGQEKQISDFIREKADREGLSSYLDDILVPTQDVVEVKKGARVTKTQTFYPGYVLLHMEMQDDLWNLILTAPKVSNFLGGKKTPTPVSKSEIEKILSQIEEKKTSAASQLSFEIGHQVKVCDGPFATFDGVVQDVYPDQERLKVEVLIFGRSTLVDLRYHQVEKT
jgi:transcriptional antiterminator NusG